MKDIMELSNNDKRAVEKLDVVYKTYFKLSAARIEEDETALRLGLMELGAATVEWLDIIVKDIEDNLNKAINDTVELNNEE